MGYFDYRHRLAFPVAPWRAGIVVGTMVMLFFAWDVAGLQLGIFATNQEYVSGLYLLTPNLPIEEIFFLAMVSYFTLLIYRYLEVVRGR